MEIIEEHDVFGAQGAERLAGQTILAAGQVFALTASMAPRVEMVARQAEVASQSISTSLRRHSSSLMANGLRTARAYWKSMHAILSRSMTARDRQRYFDYLPNRADSSLSLSSRSASCPSLSAR